MLVLSIDSSSNAAACAIVDENHVLGEICLTDKKQHSIILMDLIDKILKDCELTVSDLDGFVISKGPGSFTGLRIGMATIKGLSFGSSKPCVSVSSLDGLAYNVSSFNGLICPIIDALRNNVYTCIYKMDGDELIILQEPMCISLDELLTILKEKDEPVMFLGDGTIKHRAFLKDNLAKACFAPNHSNYTRASSLGHLGIKLLEQGIQDDLNVSSPVYLRKSQAEREYDIRMGIE